MSLPAGWQEVITSSPLLITLLILLGASLLVLFLAPFCFKLVRRAKLPKFPKKLHLPRKNLKLAASIILVILISIFGVYFYQNYFKSQRTASKNPQVEKERVGPRGDFQVNLTRKGEKIILNWEKSVNVNRVLLVKLGKDTTDDDNVLVWGISTVASLTNIDPEKLKQAFSAPLEKSAKPKLISPPYELLSKPAGFYYDQSVKGDLAKVKLEKGSRYAVELQGMKDNKSAVVAYYIFDY